MQLFLPLLVLQNSVSGAKLRNVPGIDNEKWYQENGKTTWGSADVYRKITGNFYRKFRDWTRLSRTNEGIRFKSFDSLLAMIAFSKNVNSKATMTNQLSEQQQFQEFRDEMNRLEKQYTNYGCYCWIDGVDLGVQGGGKARDKADFHCKELYRCYKCLGIDFNATHADMAEMEYKVNLSIDKRGNKEMTCEDNFDMTDGCPRNLCECDKRFAEAIANVDDTCETLKADNDPTNDFEGDFCQKKQHYTKTSEFEDLNPVTNPGTFDSHDIQQCEKSFHEHDNNVCCGVYPDRYPYDPTLRECCEVDQVDEFLQAFVKVETLTPMGTCESDHNGKFIEPTHHVHNHAHDTVMGTNSTVLGRSRIVRRF